jgi:biopolymer transport protein ExbD
MRFIVRKRRTAPAVIIVALIDVLVVLLIFLMVTTTFRQQPLLKLALPTSAQAQKSGAEEHPPLLVSIDKEGLLRFGQNSDAVTPDQLRSQLIAEAQKLRAANQEVRLAVRADKEAPWFRIVYVMDLAKEAKITSLSAFTKEAAKQ